MIELYSYREFLELQRRSNEHLDEKMRKMYAKAKQNEKKVEEDKEPPEEEAPYGISFKKP
ncbi:MAG: hypothetical protein ACOX1Q_10475 [Eubacteriales bacterium]